MAKSTNFKFETKAAGNNAIIKWIIAGAIGVVGVAIAIKLIKNYRKTKTGNDVIQDENVKIAMELNSAIHPGRNWLSDLVTSADSDTIFQILNEVKDFDTVATEYFKLYNESLAHELQNALGDEYADALELLGKVQTGSNITTQSEIEIIADDLYSQISGWNWTTRNLEPFNKMNRLSDSDFKKVVSAYSKYGDFRSDLEGESGWGVLSGSMQSSDFGEAQEKLLNRYDNLY
jgi:hypothetical protein